MVPWLNVFVVGADQAGLISHAKAQKVSLNPFVKQRGYYFKNVDASCEMHVLLMDKLLNEVLSLPYRN